MPTETPPQGTKLHSSSEASGGRLAGIDLARGLAVAAMILVNFQLTLGGPLATQTGPGGAWHWIGTSLGAAFQGRASALFVLLAGVGIAIMERSRGPLVRRTLIRRGLILVAVGLGLLTVWPADILHYYGFWFVLAAALPLGRPRLYLALAAVLTAAFPALLAAGVSYEAHWNFDTLDYANIWSADGMIRHAVFNGFHPTVPWLAFLLLGRGLAPWFLDPERPKLGLAAASGTIAVAAEWSSRRLVAMTTDADLQSILGTASMPPGPLYVIAAAATAVCALSLCLVVERRIGVRGPLAIVAGAGRLALSLYVAHVLFGILPFHLDEGRPQGPELGAATVAAYWAGWTAVMLTLAWLVDSKGKRGPLEYAFRRLSGRR